LRDERDEREVGAMNIAIFARKKLMFLEGIGGEWGGKKPMLIDMIQDLSNRSPAQPRKLFSLFARNHLILGAVSV